MSTKVNDTSKRAAQVFQSGTEKDLTEYWQHLFEKIDNSQFNLTRFTRLNRDHIDIPGFVKRIIEENTDIFLGVFGFRYGEIPTTELDGSRRSITRIEYEMALKLNAERAKPSIVVAVPMHFQDYEECEYCQRLHEDARKAALASYKKDVDKAIGDLEDQTFFLEGIALRADRLTLKFCKKEDLVYQVATALCGISLEHEEKAKQKANDRIVSYRRKLSRIRRQIRRKLDLFGCQRQLNQADDFRRELEKLGKDVAAGMLLLAQGPPSTGVGRFVRILSNSDLFDCAASPPDPIYMPALIPRNMFGVWQTLWSLTGKVRSSDWANANDFAAAASEACQHGDIVFSYDGLELYPGGVDKFIEDVWVPLNAALARSWKTQEPRGKFFLIGTLRSDVVEPSAKLVCSDPPSDVALLAKAFILERLSGVSISEVKEWLVEVGFPSIQAKDIAEQLLRDGKDPDGVQQRLLELTSVKAKLEENYEYEISNC